MAVSKSLLASTGTVGAIAIAALLTGCPPPNDIMDAGRDVQTPDTAQPDIQGTDASDVQTPMDVQGNDVQGSDATDVATDNGMVTCPANPPEERITTAEISTSTTWDCNRTYVLDTATPIFITGTNTVLTIGPGTRVVGLRPQAALIFTRGTRIEALGTRTQPVVFTSGRPEGMRAAGDWGGIALLGRASINSAPAMIGTGENQLEGLDATDMRGRYGGGATPDDAYNCGTIRYTRIEFAGYTLGANNELNGLTMAGCGSATTVDFVQVHRGADDGIEIFGGTVNVRHAVITQSDDDGLDWDQGWRGNGQFIVVQGPPMSGESDPNGIEADNDRDVNTSTPTSEPTLYNVSLFGAGNTVSLAANRAAVLRRGTGGRMYNFLIQGYSTEGLDVRDMATFNLANATPSRLFFENSIILENGTSGFAHFSPMGMTAFNEEQWFTNAARNNRASSATTAVTCGVPAPYNPTAPNFVPPTGSTCAMGAATPMGAFFDATATFVGAIRPGETDNWTSGWTSYPAN